MPLCLPAVAIVQAFAVAPLNISCFLGLFRLGMVSGYRGNWPSNHTRPVWIEFFSI